MGNQPSGTTTSSSSAAAAATTSSSTHISAEDRFRPLVAPFIRQTGSLGLSRQELDKRCQPSGYVHSIFPLFNLCCDNSWKELFDVAVCVCVCVFLVDENQILQSLFFKTFVVVTRQKLNHRPFNFIILPFVFRLLVVLVVVLGMNSLYQDCQWEDKAIRRLIADGRLAARMVGSDDRRTACDQECPVCMLYYDELNVTKCCNALICSECFLQIRPQKGKDSSCPYCNSTDKFSISIAKKPTAEEINNRTRDEQTVIEAKIRATNPTMCDNNNSSNCDASGLKKPPPTDATSSNGTGSAKIAPDNFDPSTPLSSTPTKTGGRRWRRKTDQKPY